VKSHLLIVGSLAFDDLEMPYGTYENVVGGAATYSSLSASHFAPVRVVGVVGADFPEDTLSRIAARGVDTRGVERAAGKTFRWRGRYSKDLGSRESLDTQLNVFADFRPKIIPEYRDSEYVLLGNIHPALQLEVLSQVTAPKLVAADTMNFWISGERKLLTEVLAKVSLLTINDEEARELSGEHALPKAARAIRATLATDRGPSTLIIKRGEHGALLFDEHGVFFVPAYPLEDVKDPTGAGDSFAGGLLGHLTRTGQVSARALRAAMFFGSAMGSFCVEDVGPARLFALEKQDLSRRLDGFRKMVDTHGALEEV
jgi:sugar/nucleoside kinase (ribokinase family)